MADLRSKALESVGETPVLQVLFDSVVKLVTRVNRHVSWSLRGIESSRTACTNARLRSPLALDTRIGAFTRDCRDKKWTANDMVQQ